MCDTKSVILTGLAAATVFTGGAALAAAGGAAATFAGVGAGTAALAGATGMVGLYTAYSQNEQSKMQQESFNRQAKIGDEQAADALKRGATAEDNQRAQARLLEGEQRARMGAGGGALGSGTNAEVLGQTTRMGELDALTVRANAAREAWGYRTGADTTRYQGELARAKGRYDAMGSILTSGVQAYGQYRR